MKYIAALDVGGTSIKAGLVSVQNKKLSLQEESYLTYPSYSDRSAEAIFDQLADIIERTSYFTSVPLAGLAIGFPGPFDYSNGVSLIKGIGKFDAIYGERLIPQLKKRLVSKAGGSRFAGLRTIFLNDAWAFAKGEVRCGIAQGFHKVMCITLGTGCGSAFLIDGCLVQGEGGAPQSGMLFDEPFEEGIIDDYISRRYLLRCAAAHGFPPELDGKELSALAKEGERDAIKVFEEYGRMMGRALRPTLSRFIPDVLLLGGRLSEAWNFIYPAFSETSAPYCPKTAVSSSLSRSALLGAAAEWEEKAI